MKTKFKWLRTTDDTIESDLEKLSSEGWTVLQVIVIPESTHENREIRVLLSIKVEEIPYR